MLPLDKRYEKNHLIYLRDCIQTLEDEFKQELHSTKRDVYEMQQQHKAVQAINRNFNAIQQRMHDWDLRFQTLHDWNLEIRRLYYTLSNISVQIEEFEKDIPDTQRVTCDPTAENIYYCNSIYFKELPPKNRGDSAQIRLTFMPCILLQGAKSIERIMTAFEARKDNDDFILTIYYKDMTLSDIFDQYAKNILDEHPNLKEKFLQFSEMENDLNYEKHIEIYVANQTSANKKCLHDLLYNLQQHFGDLNRSEITRVRKSFETMIAPGATGAVAFAKKCA